MLPLPLFAAPPVHTQETRHQGDKVVISGFRKGGGGVLSPRSGPGYGAMAHNYRRITRKKYMYRSGLMLCCNSTAITGLFLSARADKQACSRGDNRMNSYNLFCTKNMDPERRVQD